MKNIIKLIVLTSVFYCNACFGNVNELNIIYPPNGHKTSAESIFFIGNANPLSITKINQENLKTYNNGYFIKIAKLNHGSNFFTFTNNKKSIKYEIIRQKQSPLIMDKPILLKEPFIAETNKEFTVIRTNTNMARLTPLPKGTKITVTGKTGNEYLFKYGLSEAYIKGSDINIITDGYGINKNIFSSIKIEENDCFTTVIIPLKEKLPFSIRESFDNKISLTLYDTISNLNLYKIPKNNSLIENLDIFQNDNNSLTIDIKTKGLFGYSYKYQNNNLILKLKKIHFNHEKPLKNKIITIDAGHGGEESGAIGFTKTPEKEINLKIALILKKLLEKEEAKVIMTREKDNYVDLYERVEIAKNNNSDILISIHNNALPDGENPLETHGCSTYFYHNHSLLLAKLLQKELLTETQFKDNGVYYDSLVLTRPTDFPAVLIEGGFMIHPEEYNFLKTEEGQKKIAKALFNGIKAYFLEKQTLY